MPETTISRKEYRRLKKILKTARAAEHLLRSCQSEGGEIVGVDDQSSDRDYDALLDCFQNPGIGSPVNPRKAADRLLERLGGITVRR